MPASRDDKNYGVAMSGSEKTERRLGPSRSLNRCSPVTDKAERAWQNRAIRCKADVWKSVYRELSNLALVA
jgi:hypothetical protein